MIQVNKRLLGLALMAIASVGPSTLAERAPPFEVPNFDYETLSTGNTPNDVLNALKKEGIVSFSNIPSYAQVRRSYLDSAAACAVSAQEVNAQFLLHKTLTDGTKRFTISTPSGQDANATAITTDAACPGYKEIYNEFSSLLELVVLSVATALDATDFVTKDGYGQTISSRKLMTDAVRLDHFHAYEMPSFHERRLMSPFSDTNATFASENDFTIGLHEDNGMFIVCSTPTFYKVDSDGTKRTFESVSAGGEDDSESGLIIQRRDGQRVRPVLKPDQVTLMVGTGYNQWVDTSEQLPAVMHAVRMPAVETTATQRLLRAWFGKMTLLPSYQRMLKQIDFDVHANMTAHYVQQGYQSDRPLLGCAPGRRLAASADETCTYRECTKKSNADAPGDGCAVVCNRNHGTDAADCSKSCDCKASSHSATVCWMLCVMDLDSCSLQQQSCSGLAKVCAPSSATTSHTASAPAPAPEPAPVIAPVRNPAPAPVPEPAPVIAPARNPAPAPAPASVPAPVIPPVRNPAPASVPVQNPAPVTAPTPALVVQRLPSTPKSPSTVASTHSVPSTPFAAPSSGANSFPQAVPVTQSGEHRDPPTETSVRTALSPTAPSESNHAKCSMPNFPPPPPPITPVHKQCK